MGALGPPGRDGEPGGLPVPGRPVAAAAAPPVPHPGRVPLERAADPALPEPELGGALARLPDSHRVAVLLVHGHGWTYQEAAIVLGVRVTTIRNWVHRGMRRLRAELSEREVDG